MSDDATEIVSHVRFSRRLGVSDDIVSEVPEDDDDDDDEDEDVDDNDDADETEIVLRLRGNGLGGAAGIRRRRRTGGGGGAEDAAGDRRSPPSAVSSPSVSKMDHRNGTNALVGRGGSSDWRGNIRGRRLACIFDNDQLASLSFVFFSNT
jgi:hypothetical protein